MVALLCRCVVLHAAEDEPTRLLRQPAVSREDKDPQLDAAIAQVLGQLQTAKPIPLRTAPAYPTQVGR